MIELSEKRRAIVSNANMQILAVRDNARDGAELFLRAYTQHIYPHTPAEVLLTPSPETRTAR
jgi:hypothetical protein